jgi:prephenate dehydrogenase
MKLALIGVGLIGGSFALAMQAAGRFAHIAGFDVDPEAMRRARDMGVISEAAASAADAVAAANLVVLATPVGATASLLREIGPALEESAVVTDVGSTKAGVIAAARAALGTAFARFVPGHPIAGRELPGVEHAEASLFRDKLYVCTPVAETDASAIATVEEHWRAAGSRIEHMTPDEHDRVFAAVSHLPHLLAFALVAQIAGDADAERKFALAGAGFRDFTRIAASSPSMWRDVCLANRDAIGAELNAYRAVLDELQRALDAADGAAMHRVFARAAAARRAHSNRLDAE